MPVLPIYTLVSLCFSISLRCQKLLYYRFLLAPTPFFDPRNIDHKDIEIIRDAVQTQAVKETKEELPQSVLG